MKKKRAAKKIKLMHTIWHTKKKKKYEKEEKYENRTRRSVF